MPKEEWRRLWMYASTIYCSSTHCGITQLSDPLHDQSGHTLNLAIRDRVVVVLASESEGQSTQGTTATWHRRIVTVDDIVYCSHHEVVEILCRLLNILTRTIHWYNYYVQSMRCTLSPEYIARRDVSPIFWILDSDGAYYTQDSAGRNDNCI